MARTRSGSMGSWSAGSGGAKYKDTYLVRNSSVSYVLILEESLRSKSFMRQE